jgi:signal transduction histidine kinase
MGIIIAAVFFAIAIAVQSGIAGISMGITNALAGDWISLIIEFSYRVLAEGLMVIYKDNGEGIPAEYKEAIFERKFFKHTGFGLFLSRTILGITGMTIRETGEPGKGARFEIMVPMGAYRFTNSG